MQRIGASRFRRTFTILGLIALAATVTVTGAAGADGQKPAGFIYGTVTTRSGNDYVGLLRWGGEEAFWDDLFNATKQTRKQLEEYLDDTPRRGTVKVPGGVVHYKWNRSAMRLVAIRFGDLRQVQPRRGGRVEVTLRNGDTFTWDGGSNDIGAEITVQDDQLGDVELDWDAIDRVVFKATPRRARPRGERLFGKVTTEGGTFEGFIQWDSQESLTTDRLDGESEDGELSIRMGQLRRIEKRDSRGVRIEVKDGRRFELEGTNDVNSSNRGIWVEDPRYGRVKISWELFEAVEFSPSSSSGRSYEDFPLPAELRGTVSTADGTKHTGALAFDLDETQSWEMLNGNLRGVEFYIPFERVKAVEPGRRDSSLVTLRSGEQLRLVDGQDVSESNDGVLVNAEGENTYFRWRDVQRIVFE